MQTNHPDKQKVREVMQRHREQRRLPLTPADYRRELGWGLVEAERAARRAK